VCVTCPIERAPKYLSQILIVHFARSPDYGTDNELKMSFSGGSPDGRKAINLPGGPRVYLPIYSINSVNSSPLLPFVKKGLPGQLQVPGVVPDKSKRLFHIDAWHGVGRFSSLCS